MQNGRLHSYATSAESLITQSRLGFSLQDLLPRQIDEDLLQAIESSDNFQHFITLWVTEKDTKGGACCLQNLLLAFIFQQAALLAIEDKPKIERLQLSLLHYEYFQLEQKGQLEAAFFAQWQLSLVMEQLGFPWEKVEQCLVKSKQ
jgi:hypothetical protein